MREILNNNFGYRDGIRPMSVARALHLRGQAGLGVNLQRGKWRVWPRGYVEPLRHGGAAICYFITAVGVL